MMFHGIELDDYVFRLRVFSCNYGKEIFHNYAHHLILFHELIIHCNPKNYTIENR